MSIAYETTKIRKSPSEDASKVGSWIIAPSLLGFFFGACAFGGWAGTKIFTGYSFVFFYMLFGGGAVGLIVLLFRMITYDKRPYVIENKTTPIMFEEEKEQAPPIGGSYSGSIQTKGSVTVSHDKYEYEFTSEQIRLMLDRVEKEDYTIAQNPLKFKPGDDYQTACWIMEHKDFWQVERAKGKIKKVEWLDDGLGWLHSQTRQ